MLLSELVEVLEHVRAPPHIGATRARFPLAADIAERLRFIVAVTRPFVEEGHVVDDPTHYELTQAGRDFLERARAVFPRAHAHGATP